MHLLHFLCLESSEDVCLLLLGERTRWVELSRQGLLSFTVTVKSSHTHLSPQNHIALVGKHQLLCRMNQLSPCFLSAWFQSRVYVYAFGESRAC